MNKPIFKTKIKEFFSEIESRKTEIANGVLDTKLQVGKNLLDYIKTFKKEEFKLTYSTGSIGLNIIFHLGSKQTLHNASNFTDITRLYNAIKYEILANIETYNDISLEDFYYVYWGYLTRLMRNFNWTCTYNTDGQINQYGIKTSGSSINYLSWMNNDKTNILSDYAIERTYNTIIVEKDDTVTDINGDIKHIKPRNNHYFMKRLSKTELLEIIRKFDYQPSVKEITDAYMSTVDLIDVDSIDNEEEYFKAVEANKAKTISEVLMRKYIKEYELESLIKKVRIRK